MKLVKLALMMLLATLLAAPLLHAAKMKPEELVAKHLASIGTPEALAAAKSRSVEGDETMDVIVGGKGTLQGPASLISSGPRLKLLMNFSNPTYLGEEFIYDGQKSYTGMYRPGSRSQLADFVLAQDMILKDGLLGGTLSTAWALLDVAGRNPKLSYDGLKKVDGRQLHQVTYEARKGGSDLTARLYFEPETFRHVYSVYTVELGAQLGNPSVSLKGGDKGSGAQTTSAETNSARQQVTRIKLEEFFSDFTTANAVTLPSTWKLRFTTEANRSMILEYALKVSKLENNVTLPDNAFQPSGLGPSN